MPKHWSYVVVAVLLALPAAADVWDIQNDNDDTSGTDNELLHGTRQTHDLGVRPGPVFDLDWYRMPQKPYTSYEVIIDGVSGDLRPGMGMNRVAVIGTTVTLSQIDVPAVTGSSGYSRALRWMNTTSATVDNEYIRVGAALCNTNCGPQDTYTIRVHETTINVPRFNTTGGQTTVLLIQNASERPIAMSSSFWSSTGTWLAGFSLGNFPPKSLYAFNVATVGALTNQSGSITIAHDAGYGGLVVKAVALEPATGFSFDTPGVYVPD